MSIDLVLDCPTCGGNALADDEFCEACGSPLGALRNVPHDHVELATDLASGVTDRGLVHARNEDAFFIETIGRAAVAVVCDGVSTAAAPQVAARVAALAAGEHLTAAFHAGEPDHDDVVTNALTAADVAVLAVPWLRSSDVDPPSCTIVAALWDGFTITIGWRGDSRAYWLGTGGPQLLTVDHSWMQAQVDAGLSNAEALADRRAHAITRWLGPDSPDLPLGLTSWRPAGPGRLLVCSDGLWNYVPDASEIAILVDSGPVDEPAIDVARRLTRIALDRGGRDNVTVVVVDIQADRHDPNEEELS